jgi:hypothetical protein
VLETAVRTTATRTAAREPWKLRDRGLLTITLDHKPDATVSFYATESNRVVEGTVSSQPKWLAIGVHLKTGQAGVRPCGHMHLCREKCLSRHRRSLLAGDLPGLFCRPVDPLACQRAPTTHAKPPNPSRSPRLPPSLKLWRTRRRIRVGDKPRPTVGMAMRPQRWAMPV